MNQAKNKEAGGKQSNPSAEHQDLNTGQVETLREAMGADPLSVWSSKGTNSKQERSNSVTLKWGCLLLPRNGNKRERCQKCVWAVVTRRKRMWTGESR
jgi:hypothetical protein